MLYVLLAIITSMAIIILFKLFEKFGISIFQAIIINYLIAIIFCVAFSDIKINLISITGTSWFKYALLNGILFILMFNIFGISTQKAGISVSVISSKMSIIIPVIFAFIYFNDSVNLLRIAGIFLALIAFYLASVKNRSNKKISMPLFLLPLVLFAGSGINDTLLNYVMLKELEKNELPSYLLAVFIISFFIGAIITIFLVSTKKIKITLKNICGGIILGIFNFYSTYYFMKAIGSRKFDSSVFFPLFNSTIICLSALAGLLFFHEKLSRVNLIGLISAIAAIFLVANS
ncbi:MAG: EamA family transporter [Bacteroidales bacterium]|jgi:drug/metabolite transporter (DMT)-like permease